MASPSLLVTSPGVCYRADEQALAIGEADRAGLAQGDQIVAAAGQPIRNPDDLFDALTAARDGTIELTIVRGTSERTLQVSLAGNPQPGQDA